MSLPAQAAELTVAAAADMRLAMDALVGEYRKRHAGAIAPVYGSTGKLAAQIEHGAPFDLFFAADARYPRELEGRGLVVPGSRFRYGTGRLVLWVARGSGLEVARGMAVLGDARVRSIAIANPAHAPYGRAAVEAMTAAGVYPAIRERLVMGENVSQAAQFAASGNAQVGLLARSLILTPALRAGRTWLVPDALHGELAQEAVILRQSERRQEAVAFCAFVRAPAGQAILERFGFLGAGQP